MATITDDKFEVICGLIRKEIGRQGRILWNIKEHSVFRDPETYSGQHGEMKANIMLAYRHLEDARMRVVKVLQAADDGVSILDKPPIKKPNR